MNPQQPIQPIYTAPPLPQQNTGGWSQKQKRIMLITGIFAGVALLLILFVVIFGNKQSATEVSLTTVSAKNTGILNLIDEFESKLRTTEGRDYASRAKILITSDNLAILDYLDSRYSTAPSKQQLENSNLASAVDTLENSFSQNNFDKLFIDTINNEINTNKTLLEKIIKANSSDTVLEPILSTVIDNYDSLLN